jgi:mono/diheme cytochrome c family protein
MVKSRFSMCHRPYAICCLCWWARWPKRAVNTFIKPKEEDEMKSVLSTLALALVAGTLLIGVASGADVAKGKAAYNQYCASCHGATGKGDGPAAAALNPKPRDLSDKAYARSLKDEYLFQVTKDGGPAVKKSPLMPGWGKSLKDDQIKDVVAYLRSLAK